MVLDIAAVWVPRSTPSSPTWITGCSGLLLESRPGPGDWYWHERVSTTAYGASYVSLPKSVPPDEPTSGVLATEGLLGLAWGGGKWFAGKFAKGLVGRGVESGGQDTTGGLLKRGIRSSKKGHAYIGRPRRTVFPDVIDVGGQKYTVVVLLQSIRMMWVQLSI